jgi:hypothetical protein
MPTESVISIKDLSQIRDGSFVTPANLSRQKLPICAPGLTVATAGRPRGLPNAPSRISPQGFSALSALPLHP